MDPLSLFVGMLVFGAVVTALLAMAGTGGTSLARERLEAFKRGGAETEIAPQVQPIGTRVFGPAMHSLTGGLGNILPSGILRGVEKQLVTAGEPMTMHGFLTMVVVSTAVSAGFGLMLVFAMGASIGPLQLGIFGVLALIGFYLPFYMVASRARQRQSAIIKSLPDAFDLITTCVEAGLGLDAALSRVAEKVEGPFSQELSRSLRDIALGKSRKDSLKELGERTQVPDLIQFTNAVVQAETMGSSVGMVLRVQSDQLRVRRRQRAEQQAYKAPVKMLFPLVLCIFPTLFIVILGPAVITIMQGFPK